MQGIIRLISINYEDTKQAIKSWNNLQLSGLRTCHYKMLEIQELSKEKKTSPSVQTEGTFTQQKCTKK